MTSFVFLIASAVSALITVIDIAAGHRQKMAVMNFVWPITALWSGPLGLVAYFAIGRRPIQAKPIWQIVLLANTHCGAGCTVGDFIGEWIVFLTAFTIAGSKLWANYLADFILAFCIGIVFQYFSIAPMRYIRMGRDQSSAQGGRSFFDRIRSGNVRLNGAHESCFFKPALEPLQPAYWFMMQIAMLIGFLTAYPANWWLLRRGIKEAM